MRDLVASEIDDEVGASTKHTSTAVNLRINHAYRRYRALVLEFDAELAIKRATAQTDPATSGGDTLAPNQYVALPADFEVLRAVSVTDGEQERLLYPFEQEEGEDYDCQLSGQRTGLPTQFRLSTINDGSRVLRLIPDVDAAYTITFHYIATHTDVSLDAGTFDFIPGGELWTAIEAARPIIRKDGVAEPAVLADMLDHQRQLEDDMRRWARRASRTGPRRVMDTRGRRRMNEFLGATRLY